MKRMKFVAAIVAFATTALSLTGCSQKFDAKLYVEGSLDAFFKYEFSEDFVKMYKGGEEAIKAEYDKAINDMVAEFEGPGISQEIVDEFTIVAKDMLKAFKYTVGDAVEDGDNFTVPVTAEPLLMDMETIAAEAQTYAIEKMAEGITDEAALQDEVIKFMIEKMKEAISSPQYGEGTVITLNVVKGSDGKYTIPEEDKQALSTALISQ